MVSTPDFNTDFQQMPIGAILGASLNALIDAQASASTKAFQLFQQVALTPSGTVKTIAINYAALEPDPNNPGGTTLTTRSVDVPNALFFGYQNVSIDHADIQFKVALNSIEHEENEQATQASVALQFDARLGRWGRLAIQGSIAHQRKTVQGIEVTRNYGLDIKVHVVREDPPAILDRIMNLLMAGHLQQVSPSQ